MIFIINLWWPFSFGYLSNSVDKNIRLSNTHKYVETLVFNVKLISCRTSEKIVKILQK